MPRLNYATHLNASQLNPWRRVMVYSINDWRVSAYSLIVLSFLLIILSNLAHGDELTGLPHDDPKDILPTPPAPAQPTVVSMFAPMPGWAHGSSLPALPYQLTPMGKKPVVVVTANTPASLTPPKDAPTSVTSGNQEASAPKLPAPETPAMVTVSPFLQWIRSNPQAAANQARQQAAAQTPTAPVVNGTPTSPATAGPGSPAGTDPYWLPPLIDSAGFGTQAVGGSAAIYSTPQR